MCAAGAVTRWNFSLSDRTDSYTDALSGWKILPVKLPAPPQLKGRRLLFFSDLHLKTGKTVSITLSSCRVWERHFDFAAHLSRLISQCHVDTLLFGGDTNTETFWLPEFFSQLKTLPNNLLRVAIPGNWDRRYRWLPVSYWREQYQTAGFHFLKNESFSQNGIHFIGLDDFKDGSPYWSSRMLSDSEYNCLLVHNPDSIQLIPSGDLERISLILCGHTHGGQIRIPFFGAVKTSTRQLNFQRGFYQNSRTQTRLYISAGIGTTWYSLRLFCPPEIYLFEFI